MPRLRKNTYPAGCKPALIFARPCMSGAQRSVFVRHLHARKEDPPVALYLTFGTDNDHLAVKCLYRKRFQLDSYARSRLNQHDIPLRNRYVHRN